MKRKYVATSLIAAMFVAPVLADPEIAKDTQIKNTRLSPEETLSRKTVTSKAYVDDEISALAAHKVNGVAISNNNVSFYGRSSTTRSTAAKVVKIYNTTDGDITIDSVVPGMVVVVKPDVTSTVAPTTLQINSITPAASMRYNGAAITTDMAGKVWNSTNPSIWVFDGTYWNFVGGGTVADGLVDDLASHTVNGAPLSNLASTFYGSGTGADGEMKRVSISSIDSTTTDVLPPTGLIIVVQPTAGDTRGRFRLKLNRFLDAPVFYRGEPVNENNVEQVWSNKYPSTFVFDGTNWVFLGTVDTDTEYFSMSVNEGTTGTATDQRTLTAANLKPIIQGTTLTGLSTSTASVITASDTVTTGMGKLQAQITANDVRTHTVNGAPLSNTASYFYGAGVGVPDNAAKTVEIDSIYSVTGQTTPNGQMIVVQPEKTATKGNITLQLNKFNAAPVYYNGFVLNDDDVSKVWNEGYPSTFVFDGTNWVFMGNGQFDTDTTYTVMTDSTGTAGTSSTNMVVSPKVLKNSIQGITLANNTGRPAFTVTNARMDATTTPDTMLGALGKAQGQIDNRQYLAPATGNYLTLSNNTWTSAAVSDYDAVKGSALLTKTGTAGNLGERMIVDSDTTTTGWSTAQLNNAIPSMSMLNSATDTLTWGTPETTSTNAYDTTFVGDTGATANAWPAADKTKLINTAALAQGLALKQNRITTGLVEFNDNPNYMLPAVTTYDSTSGLVSNKIGILDYGTSMNDEGYLFEYISSNGYGAEMDNFVPTVRSVAESLNVLKWNALYWNDNTFPAAINAYSTTFDSTTTHVDGNWPYLKQQNLVRADTFANSIALKQNKIPAKTTPENLYTNGSVLTYTDSAGTVGERHIILEQAFSEMLYWDQVLPNEYKNMLVDADTVANGLVAKQDKLPTPFTSTTSPTAMASMGGETITLGGPYAGNVDRRYITAGGSQPLTQKTEADNVMLYINGTKTLAEYQTSNFGGTGSTATTNQNNIKKALVSLELLKDVYSALHSEVADTLTWGSSETTSTNAYDTTFVGDTGATANAWPAADKNKLINTSALAQGLSLKQNILPAGTNGNVVTYSGTAGQFGTPLSIMNGLNGLEELAVLENAYNFGDPETSQTTVWPLADATKLINGRAFADGLSLKQTVLPVTSSGMGNTPNYVYNATTNPTADGSVVTTTTTAGIVDQRGIATAPTYDANDNLTNGSWLPTMSAVESMVSGADISTHKVNGAPLSNQNSFFYGEGIGAAATETKTVSIASIPSTAGENPPTGLIIVVKPKTATNSSSTMKIKLNDFNAVSVNYRGSTSDLPSVIWTQYAMSAFVFDGTYWRYLGDGNSTYSAMGIAEGRTGSSGTSRAMTAKNLKGIIHGTKLTPVTADGITTLTFTPTNAAIDASTDTLMDALGKLQGQINFKQDQIAATSDGTNNTPNYVYDATNNPTADGSVVTTTGTAGTVAQRGIANAAVYTTTNNVTTLTNGDWIPNIIALETKQKKKVCYSWETGHDNDDNYCLLWLLPD